MNLNLHDENEMMRYCTFCRTFVQSKAFRGDKPSRRKFVADSALGMIQVVSSD